MINLFYLFINNAHNKNPLNKKKNVMKHYLLKL